MNKVLCGLSLVASLGCGAATAAPLLFTDESPVISTVIGLTDLQRLFEEQLVVGVAPLSPQELANTTGARASGIPDIMWRGGLAEIAWIHRMREQNRSLVISPSRVPWRVQ